MSEENRAPNEDALWDLISNPADGPKGEKPPKAPKPSAPKKTEPRFAKPKRIDGFFLACMAGVAAVSVAATLALSGMTGGSHPAGSGTPALRDPAPGETVSQAATALERENAALRAQLEQQENQIRELEEDLLKLMASQEYLSTIPSEPEENSGVIDARVEALEIFSQIQQAYADFDLEKLEELIPQMDERVGYLSPDALNSYYLILEYMEQPSNR